MGRDSRVHILHKPFGRKDLAAAVREALDDKPGHKAGDGTTAGEKTREVEPG